MRTKGEKAEMKSVHVAHFHKRGDTRIQLKQCASLSAGGVDVTLILADGLGEETHSGTRIRDLGASKNRLDRYLYKSIKAVSEIRRMEPDVVHFHDGLFLPFALYLALSGHKVFYDVHEDYSAQVMKTWFPAPAKYAISTIYTIMESVGGEVFRHILPATPAIGRKFPQHKTTLIQNYPMVEELVVANPIPFSDRPENFAYVGGASVNRGVVQVADAMAVLGRESAKLTLAGSFSPASLETDLLASEGGKYLDLRGWLDRRRVAEMLGNARAGIVTYLPAPNHIESQPNKLFEYMAAGLPVIATDFPLWREIVEEAQCGLLVDPLDPNSIAEAMKWMLDNPEAAAEMGRRGQAAVRSIYNWEAEAEKLRRVYSSFDPEGVGRAA